MKKNKLPLFLLTLLSSVPMAMGVAEAANNTGVSQTQFALRAPLEGIVANLAILRQAQDLTVDALKSLNTSGVFTLGSFGKYRVKSGSHNDIKGGGVLIATSKSFKELRTGFFAELGKSNIDTYCDNNYHGKGDGRYYGAGVLVRTKLFANDFDIDLDGGLRVGNARLNWRTTEHGKFKDDVKYFGGHFGVSREMITDGARFRWYGRYLYNHVAGMQGQIAGMDYKFRAIDSHRSRIGVYSEYDFSRSFKPYLDVAWEREFKGKSKAQIKQYQNYNNDNAPKISGNSAVLELGYTWQNKGWYARVGVSGAIGARKGVSGVVSVGYKF